MPETSFVDEALGAVLLRGGAHGAVAVAFSPEDAAVARTAWPDAAVCSPREIDLLAAWLRDDAHSLALVLAAKRILGGVLAEVRPVLRLVEQAA